MIDLRMDIEHGSSREQNRVVDKSRQISAVLL